MLLWGPISPQSIVLKPTDIGDEPLSSITSKSNGEYTKSSPFEPVTLNSHLAKTLGFVPSSRMKGDIV